MRRPLGLAIILLLVAACATPLRSDREPVKASEEFGPLRVTTHRDGDDLLAAGLGLDGLRAAVPPAFADPEAPTPAELRRRAFYANWRGIADLTPGGGFGTVWGALPPVPGREYHAFARPSGARATHRVLAQIPDAFDRRARCLVVAAASGSRGIYGAIAVAGPWALPRGCALVHTDKGAGTGVFDRDTGTGVTLDGTRAAVGAAPLEFEPEDWAAAPAHALAFKHAHSGANPEADWARHVLQAARFGLHALDLAFPAQAPFTPANTRILVVGISNGGGAVLRAAEDPAAADWFDAVVAGAPHLAPPGARPLFDFATEAALLQPCALADPRLAEAPRLQPSAVQDAQARARCARLADAGVLRADGFAAQAAEAYARLRDGGWDEPALRQAGVNVAFDLWRAVGATYVAAYARAGVSAAPCGYGFAVLDDTGAARAAHDTERAAWWADGSGIAPSAGIALRDGRARPGEADPSFPGLVCLRAAWIGADTLAARVREGVEATRATGRVYAPRVLVVHGRDDGLIPAAFTSRPWLATVRETSPAVALGAWELPHVQHFDAFLGLPALGAGHLPLLPYVQRALDAAWASIVDDAPLPPADDAVTRPRGRTADGTLAPLTAEHLGAAVLPR